jgi:hypothetical protein
MGTCREEGQEHTLESTKMGARTQHAESNITGSVPRIREPCADFNEQNWQKGEAVCLMNLTACSRCVVLSIGKCAPHSSNYSTGKRNSTAGKLKQEQTRRRTKQQQRQETWEKIAAEHLQSIPSIL